MRKTLSMFMALALALVATAGCEKKSNQQSSSTTPASTASRPKFVLGWSEYPSSSAFGVASDKGLLNGKEGEYGPVENKWGVDIVLKQVDYDTLMTMYGNGQADAVCIIAPDTLTVSKSRPAVNIIPVSWSNGGDAILTTTGATDIAQLKGKEIRGLENSVSQYLFERVLEKNNLRPTDYQYKNSDPAAAAQGMQTKQNGYETIVVWNPFIMQTLRTRTDAKVLVDSSAIPEEIVDVVVMGKDSLAKPGGENFAAAVCDTYYYFNHRLADPNQADRLTVALGEKFSNLGLTDMRDVLKKTVFYKTPEEALALYNSDKFRKQTMPQVVKFYADHKMTPGPVQIGFDDPNAQVNFSTKYIKMAASSAPWASTTATQPSGSVSAYVQYGSENTPHRVQTEPLPNGGTRVEVTLPQ